MSDFCGTRCLCSQPRSGHSAIFSMNKYLLDFIKRCIDLSITIRLLWAVSICSALSCPAMKTKDMVYCKILRANERQQM